MNPSSPPPPPPPPPPPSPPPLPPLPPPLPPLPPLPPPLRPPSERLGFGRRALVLAAAHTGGQEDENGFISAAELINMDLRGTELVVLSACETGIGEVQIGEGIQGLSKALQVAGSETQVLSLWKVSVFFNDIVTLFILSFIFVLWL